jgi:hypothetical protein
MTNGIRLGDQGVPTPVLVAGEYCREIKDMETFKAEEEYKGLTKSFQNTFTYFQSPEPKEHFSSTTKILFIYFQTDSVNMPFIRLVVAGTGGLAKLAIPAILSSTQPKFEVTILTRKTSSTPPSFPGAKVVQVDYSDHAELVRLSAGADAIVSLVNGGISRIVDRQLLAAAQEAGVRRIFPSEYSLEILHPSAQSLLTLDKPWPDNLAVVPLAKEFVDLANKGGPTSFTTIVPSAFIDEWVKGSFALFEPKNNKVTVLDGGDHPFTGSSLPFIAGCLVAALKMDEEKTKNKRLHVSEVRTTVNEIISLYEKITGRGFERVPITTQELTEQRNRYFADGQSFPAILTTIQIAAFGGGGAGDLEDGLQFDGDGFLDVKRKSIEQLVREGLEMIGVA